MTLRSYSRSAAPRFGNDAGGHRLLDLSRQVQGRDLAGLHAIDTNALLDRLDALCEQQASCSSPSGFVGSSVQ